jgi:serine/threonine protein kinase
MENGEQVKVIDFGTAATFNPEKGMNTMLGTPYYMAPEIFN